MKTLPFFLFALSALAQTDYQISGIMVDHLTNHPLNHVLVEITRMGKPGGTASVLTEADGRFTFLHVPKGKYNLQAQKRGQFPIGYHSSDGGYATAIVVDGTLKTDGIIFALRTDASINGTLIGDDGEGIRNAQVQLFRESVNDGEPQTVQMNSASTSSSGQFHFGHLEPGKYYVSASGNPWYSQMVASQPGMETVYPVTFYGDTTEGDAARSIVLTEGVSATIQISMHAVPGIRVKLANGHQNIMLAVPGPGGTQIPVSASISGTSTGISNSRTSNGQLLINSEENNLTNWELTNIPAGHFEVMSYGQTGEQTQNSKTVDLTNGSTLSLDASSPPAEVSGRIIFDGPRPEGELNIFLSGGRRGLNASVAADGTFKFDKLSAGTFDLNMNEMVITSIEAKGARLVHDRVDVLSGASVELTLHAQSAESLSSIEGIAMQGESGIAGAMVLLIPQDLQRVRLIRRDQSDGDGSFSLPNVLPGKYMLVAIDDGHDLAYKGEKVIKPYLAGGVALTIPLKTNHPVKVNVQTRQR